jgi:hypothetical protein
MGIEGSFAGGKKRPRSEVDHSPPLPHMSSWHGV